MSRPEKWSGRSSLFLALANLPQIDDENQGLNSVDKTNRNLCRASARPCLADAHIKVVCLLHIRSSVKTLPFQRIRMSRSQPPKKLFTAPFLTSVKNKLEFLIGVRNHLFSLENIVCVTFSKKPLLAQDVGDNVATSPY